MTAMTRLRFTTRFAPAHAAAVGHVRPLLVAVVLVAAAAAVSVLLSGPMH